MPLSWYAMEIELSTFHCDMLSSLYEIAQVTGIGISNSKALTCSFWLSASYKI